MSCLDDFFAKKDKRKSGTKANLLAADELYRTLEEAAKTPDDGGDNTDEPKSMGNAHVSLEFGVRFSDEANDADEWCDFTEEYRKRFAAASRTSKHIQSAADLTEQEQLAERNQDNGGDGIDVGAEEGTKKAACPWQNIVPLEMSMQHLDMADSCLESPAKPALSGSDADKKEVYVPPALRQTHSDINVRSRKQPAPIQAKLGKGQAPDLNNVDYFPMLCNSRVPKRAK